jgi:LysR family transcriptional regulator, benzoate and cis,cis-muconate-responsive activator of ben and cat genes
MELRHLRYFVTVAEELNITKAAMRLNVSQPPLSRQIRDLENELGVVLLERSPKEVRLTSVGRVFFKEARGVLRQAAEAVRKAREFGEAKASELRVGYAPSPTAEILPRALRAFQKAAPKARVELLDQSTQESLAGLTTGTIDVALVVRPPLKRRSGLVFEKLMELSVGIIVPPEHRFARRRTVTLDEALSEPLVPYIRKGYADYHHWLSGVLKRARRKPRLVTAVDGAISLIAAVEAGQGIGFAPSTFAGVAGRRVKFVPLSATPPLAVGYIVPATRRSEIVDTFIHALQSIARKSDSKA